MSQFLESIRFEDGQFHLLDLHQERVNRTFAAFYPGLKPLELANVLPDFNKPGKHKFRVEYDAVSFEINHSLYEPKVIKSVKLMNADHLDYSFKYADRTALNELLKMAGSDEIIIVKDGLLTDASYANLALFDGQKWWTPERPLLEGVRRQSLLNEGQLFAKKIKSDDLSNYTKVCLINSMLDLEELNLDISIVD